MTGTGRGRSQRERSQSGGTVTQGAGPRGVSDLRGGGAYVRGRGRGQCRCDQSMV